MAVALDTEIAADVKDSKPRDVAQHEYRGMTDDEKRALRRHRNAIEVSVDYCTPYFDKFIRMSDLYHGVLPPELDSTFSKVMLAIAFSIVQNEMPRRAAALFSGEDFFNLEATNRELENSADEAKNWLNYQARNRNQIFPRIIPTLTRTCIYGTAYRAVTHMPIVKHKQTRTPAASFAGVPYSFQDEFKETIENGIFSENVDIWNFMPAPNGTMMNTLDNESEEAIEWGHWIQYISKAKLKALQKKKFANSRAIQEMLDGPKGRSSDEFAIDSNYRQRASAGSLDYSLSDWVEKQRNEAKEGIEGRYRCVWTMYRDKWSLIGENKYVLYDGPPMLDWIPMAKYVDTPDPDCFFGTGMLEVCEDVILAYLLNFNFRMDYLATTLHPTKFVRDDLVKSNGGNLIDFDPQPYGVFQFSKKVQDIQKAIWYDRFPEISPMAFAEESTFKQLLQEITAQPNYMKGMGGGGTLANETATGIVSLIEEGTARSTMRALNSEYIGLHDELMLMLKWGKKYVFEDQVVRSPTNDGSYPWTNIPYAAIDDGYGIELMGTRSLVHKNEMVKRMMSALPLVINNPNVPNQKDLLKDFLKELNYSPNVNKYFEAGPMNPNSPSMPMMQGAAPGMGGTPTVQNEQQAVQGRTGPAQGGTPANFAV